MKFITEKINVVALLFCLTWGAYGFAQTEYLTDLEGRIEPLQNAIQEGVFQLQPDGSLTLADSTKQFVYGGDLGDRGPNTIKMMRYLIALKRAYPTRVHLIMGNRDLNKLSFFYDLQEKMKSLQSEKYRSFLAGKAEAISVDTGNKPSLAELNTAANQVLWWAQQYGLTKAIEFHQQELRELTKQEFTLDEAAADFKDFVTNPNREYLQYVTLGQLAHIEGAAIYLHGGLPSQIGFVPEMADLPNQVGEWVNSLNQWYSGHIEKIRAAAALGSVSSQDKVLVFYGDAQFDASINKVWNHDNSTVYGPRYKEDGNFRLPPEQVLEWLKDQGISMVILGHSPAGNIPTPLKAAKIVYLMADTSYAKNGVYTRIQIRDGRINISGMLEDGSRLSYTLDPRSDDPIGRLSGRDIVAGKTGDGRYVLFHYEGYERKETLTEGFLLKSGLTAPVYKFNQESDSQKTLLLDTLAKRGVRVVDLQDYLAQELEGRTPILFAGSSAYADASQEAISTEMITAALRLLDPSKVVIFTGGTDKGPEKMVHKIATDLGFEIHGLVVSAAVPEEVSPLLKSVSWVGHAWADQPKTGMEVIKAKGGVGIILAGGGLLQKALEYGQSINAKFLVARNIKHGNGAVSASMNFSKITPSLAFESGPGLVRLLKHVSPVSMKKEIREVTSDQAINALKNRGKQIVTFIGFSALDYEDQAKFQEALNLELAKLDPKRTIINIGGTSDGIGALYRLAKDKGFETSGIVSSLAKRDWLSPFADRVYMIKDKSWGGLISGTQALSPTSRAMVYASDRVIAIGGGAVGRDEFMAAKALGIPAAFISADANHAKVLAKAAKAGKAPPTDFKGELEVELAKMAANQCSDNLTKPPSAK